FSCLRENRSFLSQSRFRGAPLPSAACFQISFYLIRKWSCKIRLRPSQMADVRFFRLLHSDCESRVKGATKWQIKSGPHFPMNLPAPLQQRAGLWLPFSDTGIL